MRIASAYGRYGLTYEAAMWLLAERAVLTTAVCTALEMSGGDYQDRRPTAAFALLRRWIGERYDLDVEGHACDGLQHMCVPDEGLVLMQEIEAGIEACEALGMLWETDVSSGYGAHGEYLQRRLDEWRALRCM